jgi:hypothetical protein
MATVYTMEKLGSVSDVVNIGVLDNSLLTLVSTEVSPDGLSTMVTYSYATGEPAYPVTVKCKITRDPKFNSGFGRVTIVLSLEATQTKVVDDVLEWAEPVKASMTLTLPGQAVVSTTELWDLITSLFGLTFPSTDGSNDASMATLARWSFFVGALK